ncbi:MAG: aconitate hydratase [Candidatus Eisenbacteria bacterium]|nr:aconitate hydratase [Candidatus Latescibacterota bacterium]MBD3301883.1 aconitate hydratase [Candidatus Eisenbacteria bacterium]
MNLAEKIIRDHLVDGEARPGEEIGIRIDQSLTQDATGTLVMLELEAIGLDRVRTELSAQYVDHNMLQQDFKNADDHRFLQSACRRFGVWYSPAGNGVSHPVHQERFGAPGKTLLGSDSHTPAAGALGMIAIGAGGLEVALAMAGEPFYFKMPEIWGVKLTGRLPDWVSAKDVVLEMLRRHGVDGGVGRIIEYYGPGLDGLTAMDRHVIANMGTELGATTTVFPADEEARRFLRSQRREEDWRELGPDPGASYDHHEEIDLSGLEPLIALPSSPGNVVPVHQAAGAMVHQTYIGSSANPGYRDFAVAAKMVEGRSVKPWVSFDINPTSRQVLSNLTRDGHLLTLIRAGARIHQTGCNGCIGMGQAPATDTISLRTVPRNFPGRSGTKEDKVHLCSPETAAASALVGVITDPRTLGMDPPDVKEPEEPMIDVELLQPPVSPDEAARTELVKGPNIASLPDLDPLPERIDAPVLLKVGDDISTDEILPAGARVLPFRSNIGKISDFAFDAIDETYADRARAEKETGHVIVGGRNYGQGSSREHAALAPRFLGLRIVIAKSFARIHWQNLVNFGVLPLQFADPSDYDRIEAGDRLAIESIRGRIRQDTKLQASIEGRNRSITLQHQLSGRQIDLLLAGGLINWMKTRLS